MKLSVILIRKRIELFDGPEGQQLFRSPLRLRLQLPWQRRPEDAAERSPLHPCRVPGWSHLLPGQEPGRVGADRDAGPRELSPTAPLPGQCWGHREGPPPCAIGHREPLLLARSHHPTASKSLKLRLSPPGAGRAPGGAGVGAAGSWPEGCWSQPGHTRTCGTGDGLMGTRIRAAREPQGPHPGPVWACGSLGAGSKGQDRVSGGSPRTSIALLAGSRGWGTGTGRNRHPRMRGSRIWRRQQWQNLGFMDSKGLGSLRQHCRTWARGVL